MGCRCTLDAAETFERHLDRRPRVEEELKRLSSRIETAQSHDNAEIERLWREHEAQEKAWERTRDIDGLEP